MKHPDDGALLRCLDRQLLAAEEAEVRQHVRTCVVCASRQAEISRTLDTVNDALQRTDVEPRGSRARNIRWPAAIAAGVLLALTLGVAPVRAWILRLPKTLWVTIIPSEINNPIAPDTLGVVEPDEASVSFVPRADVFVVEVTTRQLDGSLTIVIVNNDTATATVVGANNAEELIVLPSGFQIINAPNSIATYAVRLPARLEQIQVVVAGQPPIVLDLSEGRHEWVIPLARR